MDIISAVQELSSLGSRELNRLLKISDNFTIQSGLGSLRQINVEKLASSLPLHLIAVLLSPDLDLRLAHLLHGVRLLHVFSDLASRHARLEQILLDDVKVSEQIMDLVFYMLLVLARYEQGNHCGPSFPFLHSALVACTLHLLPGYISTQWQELVHVLLAHPKVDIFMDIAYDAVHVDIRFLHVKLSTLNNDILRNKSSLTAAEREADYLCQQCEASLQFLLSLCQQKLFRDRFLQNKELCKSGGILSLTRTILKLNIPDCFKESLDIIAAVSRIKAKVLSILLQLCEAESLSYLDEVASSPKSMQLAKSVALEILSLLKHAFRREAKKHGDSSDRSNPKGLVLLNSLQLTDILSDDSNFRSFFMTHTIEVIVQILAIPHEEFLPSWCSADTPMMEEDSNIEYDPVTAAGVALVTFTGDSENTLSAPILLNGTNSVCLSISNGISSATYAQQKTSYLVKIVANLHCFIPNICEEEERDLFVKKFNECLLAGSSEPFSRYPLKSDATRGTTICENLRSLSDHAASLIPTFLNEDDVQLLRLFSDQLQGNLLPIQNGASPSQESIVKDDDDELKYQQPMQQYLHLSSRLPNSKKSLDAKLEDAENTGRGEPSLLKKSDSAGQGEDSKVNFNDIDIRREIRERSMLHESDQFIVKGKEKHPPDDSMSIQNGKKNILVANESTPRTLRDIEKENENIESKGTEQSSKVDVDLLSDTGEVSGTPDYAKDSCFLEDDKTENVQGEEKQPRKRKRTIMDEKQMILIEKVLLEEPELQRKPISLQSWAEKLSALGSEITSSQLKNWLNNRKARLARAAKEARTPSEGDNTHLDKSCGPNTSRYYDSPDSAGEEYYAPSARSASHQSIPKTGGVLTRSASAADHEMIPRPDFGDFGAHHTIHMGRPLRCATFEPGQLVSMFDAEWKEVGKGKVFLARGRWHGKSLDDSGMCIVDVTELKTERWRGVQHPSEGAGTTFEEAAARNGGVMRVAWDVNRIFPLPQ